MTAFLHLYSTLEASHHIWRLVSWKVLGSKWIALFIIAYSAVTITLIVVIYIIGAPRFKICVSELLYLFFF